MWVSLEFNFFRKLGPKWNKLKFIMLFVNDHGLLHTFGILLMPTSITIAPGLIHSPFTMPGLPTATITHSASRTNFSRSDLDSEDYYWGVHQHQHQDQIRQQGPTSYRPAVFDDYLQLILKKSFLVFVFLFVHLDLHVNVNVNKVGARFCTCSCTTRRLIVLHKTFWFWWVQGTLWTGESMRNHDATAV